jgi:hypothetical protein
MLRSCFAHLGALALLGTALSSDAAAEADTKMAKLRKMYQACVVDSVKSAVRRGVADNNAAIELAFQACQTEEQAIVADANAAGVSPAQTNQVITGYKLTLKQTIRKLLVDAEKSAPRATSRQQVEPGPSDMPPPAGMHCSGSTRRYDGAIIWMNCR